MLVRLAIGVLVLAALIVLFYQEENWRGKRAWARAQAEAAAAGKIVEWAKLIPAAVPDEQNFFAAPHMQEWFTGRGTRDLAQRLSFQNFETWLKQPNTSVAEVTIVPPDKEIAPGDADIVLDYEEPVLTLSQGPEKAFLIKPSAEVIPLIKMEGVPLHDVIKNLAREARLNYICDCTVNFEQRLPDGSLKPETLITERWTNYTAFNALTNLLATNQLALVFDSSSGIARISAVDAAHPAGSVQIPFYVLQGEERDSLKRKNTNIIPLVVMDEVPLRDAIKNLAKEALINFTFDKSVTFGQPDRSGNTTPEPMVSVRWTNVTALQGLKALLVNYNMVMFPNPQTGMNRIVMRDPSKAVLAEKQLTEHLGKLLADAFQSVTNGETATHLTAALGFELSAKPYGTTKPAHIFVRAGTVPYSAEVKEFFPKHPLGENYPWNSETEARSTGSNTFSIYLNPPPNVAAADFLAWSDQFQDDFEAISEAAKRPYARIEGDYSAPFASPIPNFVTLRVVGQTLAERAQCELLLGHPEKAVRELGQLRSVCRMLEGRPTGKPMTLIAAMINTAITGLYVQVIADGWKLHAWREPELAELGSQLKEIDLPPYLASSLDCERVALCRTFEIMTVENERKVFGGSQGEETPWQKLQDPIYRFLLFAPRGWIYQNMVAIYRFHQSGVCCVDANGIMTPRKVEQSTKRWDELMKHPWPYRLLAAAGAPNFTRASITVAHNQTFVNEARVVCSLERYRLTYGEYPEKLDALKPKFIDLVPQDIIDGQPLKYHRDGDKFTLYSLGWNERDDGGVSVLKEDGSGDLSKGDWVWPSREKVSLNPVVAKQRGPTTVKLATGGHFNAAVEAAEAGK